MIDKKKLKEKHIHLYSFYCFLKDLHELYNVHRTNRYWENIPKEQYQGILADMFEKKFQYRLNWNNLKTYSEKMQWEKLYHKDPLKTELSDKYKVREWVKKKIGEEYLIPLIGVWDTTKSIDFTQLPNQFVLKTNKGSGDVVIVDDKEKLSKQDVKRIKRKLNISLKKNYAFDSGFEMHYADIQPKVIAEKFLEENIQDYKFLCFGGKPYYCWVDIDRFIDHRRNIYDLQWNLCDWEECYKSSDKIIEKPKNFDEMVKIAEKLCAGFAHVRVDLYNVDGKIYFGEMTFTSGSGFEIITPASMNEELGNLWEVDTTKR